jgi:hypothetical protein
MIVRCKMMSKMKESVDFWLDNHGSLGILRPYSERAKEWMDERKLENAFGQDNYLFGFGGMVIEPRYFNTIVEALTDEGYLVG